jgi:ABC-type Fe3+/spermidine/putrescine transport system ATPase subunit
MDATYRADLRELNELNFSRFDAKLEQRVVQLDAKLDQRMAELRGEFRSELRDLKAELIKWTFIFVAGGALTVLSVMITVTIAVSKL